MPQIETLGRIMNSASSTLKLQCSACGHESALTRKIAWRLFGMDATPHVIRKRAKCSKCGDRAHIKVTI